MMCNILERGPGQQTLRLGFLPSKQSRLQTRKERLLIRTAMQLSHPMLKMVKHQPCLRKAVQTDLHSEVPLSCSSALGYISACPCDVPAITVCHA